MQSILALDIGTYSIKTMILEMDLYDIKVIEAHETSIPLVPPEKLSETRRTLLRNIVEPRRKFFDTAFVCFSSHHCVTKEFELHGVKRKDVTKIMFNEFEELGLPDSENYTVEYQTLAYSEKYRKSLGIFAKKDQILSLIGDISDSQLEIQIIDHETLALINMQRLLKTTRVRDGALTSPLIFVDIGHVKTTVSLFENNKLIKIHVMQTGGHFMTSQIQKKFELTYAEAQDLKHNIEKNQEAMDLLSSLYCNLAQEIFRTLKSFCVKENKVIKGIFYTGGATKFSEFKKIMSENLGLPVEKLTLKPDSVDLPINANLITFGNCLACGLRGNFHAGNSKTNFRHGDLAVTGNQEKLINEIIRYFGIISVSLLVVIASIFIRKITFDEKIDQFRVIYKKDVQETLKKIPSDISLSLENPKFDIPTVANKTLSLINSEMNSKKKVIDNLSRLKSPLVLRILDIMSTQIPKTVYFEINSFSLQEKSLNIEFETDQASNKDIVEKNLKNISIFSHTHVKNPIPKPGSDGKLFRIQIITTVSDGV